MWAWLLSLSSLPLFFLPLSRLLRYSEARLGLFIKPRETGEFEHLSDLSHYNVQMSPTYCRQSAFDPSQLIALARQ